MIKKRIRNSRQEARARTKTLPRPSEKMQKASLTTKLEERSRPTSNWLLTNLKKT